MQIMQCLHTAILVSNLEKAEHFYSNILGLVKVDRNLNYPGIWYNVGNYQLHLMVNPNYKNTLLNTEKWGRNPHIAVAVNSFSDAIARLQSQGLPLQMSSSGRAACFTKDPDNNVIEISQLV